MNTKSKIYHTVEVCYKLNHKGIGLDEDKDNDIETIAIKHGGEKVGGGAGFGYRNSDYEFPTEKAATAAEAEFKAAGYEANYYQDADDPD